MLAARIEVPPIFRIVADDITPEAAAGLLAEQGGRIAIISAEGGIFDTIAGRYARTSNLDVFLKAHSGDELRVDRKGDPVPKYVKSPAITLGLMIQPAVLQAIAANPEFHGRGLLARFLYARPVSKVGARIIAPNAVPPHIAKRYECKLTELVAGLNGRDPVTLRLTPEAQKAITAIEAAVEPTLAEDGELSLIKEWGSKYVAAVARIAGILHLAEHGPKDGTRLPVDPETVEAAGRIGDYFKASAINAFVEMGTDQGTADAVYLSERVRHLGKAEVSERDLLRAAENSELGRS